MNDASRKMAVGALALALASTGYFWWRQQSQAPELPSMPGMAAPSAAPAARPPATEETPAVQHPLESAAEAAPGAAPGPAALADELARLVGARPWQALFVPEQLVRRIVATVDNLPRQDAPVSLWPVRPAATWIETEGEGETLAIGPANARRYEPYVAVVKAVDAPALASLYRRFYPLFQQAYAELGYPQRYFNDRVVAAIDDLLATPEPAGPLLLAPHKVRYRFVDPELDERSAGQKILLRIGVDHAREVKAKLREFRRAVAKTPAPQD